MNAVNNGEVSLDSIPTMNPIIMHPVAWRKQNEDRIVEAQQVAGGNTNLATTRLLKCGKCNKNNVRYRESQDRSADEAATIHAECIECNNVWTQ